MTYRAVVTQRDAGPPVLVAGAGAVGSVLGGLLAQAGSAVTLLGRATHLDAIREHGLEIEGLFGDHRVRDLRLVSDARDLRGTFGLVLLTVKSHDTAGMITAVAPHVAADGYLLSAQNGLGNLETATAVLGARRVLGARVIFGAELPAPGRVRVTVHAAPVLVGSPDPGDRERTAAAERWAAAFARAGIPSAPTANLVGELWAKVFYNAALNPLGALLGVPYGHLAEDADTRAIMDRVIDEAFAVARATDVRLGWPDASAYRDVFYRELVPSTAAHRSSMLQDLERGRPTEIEALNGYVARRASELGPPALANATLAHLIRARVRQTRRHEGPWGH
jgi:2-dehydropantoate 2-reductase